MLEIRPLTAELLPLLLPLDRLCFADEPFAAIWWQKAIDAQGAQAWLAIRNDEPVGYCLFSQVLDEAELLRIATVPLARQVGVGTALLAHAHQALKGCGVAQLFLEVRASNQAAQQLYCRNGWSVTGRRKDYYPLGDGREDAVLFNRVL